MKTTVVASCCISGILASFAAGLAGAGKAAAPAPGVQSIGVINLMEILLKDKRYAQEGLADQNQAQAELEALAQEIDREERELTTLKSSSLDYLKQMETVAEKKARFSAHRDFLDRQSLLKKQLRSQKLYAEIVRITHEVARAKGLSLVLVKEDPNLPQPEGMPTRLVTQKVLYCDGCPDLTQEVQARLGASKP